jgi:acetyl-CoA acetyltransferase
MAHAYIVDVVRTPVGKRNGGLAKAHPADLGAHVLKALVELNEAFAAQVLACLRELPIDPDKLNVNGGAIALGHPLGCTGAKLTATLAFELQRRTARYGLVTMCVGGGMGAAGVFERC